MAKYVIVYIGGNHPSTPEEGKQHFAKYQEWLTSLGNSVVSPMNPLKNTSTVNPDGTVTSGSVTTMSGYTIIETESMEAALEAVKACPFLDIGGSLEVSELIQMPG
jgi:hypothetical protein